MSLPRSLTALVYTAFIAAILLLPLLVDDPF